SRKANEAVDRLAGTAASLAIGVLRGARIVRVHDVPEAIAVIGVTEAIMKNGGSDSTQERLVAKSTRALNFDFETE
ncbi:MAG: head-tail joining protein, partial [Acidobacteriota bacterium]